MKVRAKPMRNCPEKVHVPSGVDIARRHVTTYSVYMCISIGNLQNYKKAVFIILFISHLIQFFIVLKIDVGRVMVPKTGYWTLAIYYLV